MINCEIELDLRWARNCIISEISKTSAVARDNPVETTLTTGAIFQVNNTKFYVPGVTLSINDNFKFLEQLKQGFRRTISWNIHKSEIRTEPKKKKLDCMIDPTFRNSNRLFVLSFKNGNDYPTRSYFDKYYMSNQRNQSNQRF